MKKLLAVIVSFLANANLFAETDNLFIKPVDNISSSVYGGNKRVWDIEFNDTGLMFVAASENLCIWDGMEWSSSKAYACLRDLHFDFKSKRLYVSGDNFFGYYILDSYGNPSFNLLYHNRNNMHFMNFWKIIPINDSIYISTHENIYTYNVQNRTIKSCPSKGKEVGYIFDGGGELHPWTSR